jgi:hypothetical protein
VIDKFDRQGLVIQHGTLWACKSGIFITYIGYGQYSCFERRTFT